MVNRPNKKWNEIIPEPNQKRTQFRQKGWQRVSDSDLYYGTQAYRIFRRFGGAVLLMNALNEAGYKINKSSIFRWDYDTSIGGQGGVIPNNWILKVCEAARLQGIHLTSEDLDPRPDAPPPTQIWKAERYHGGGYVDEFGVYRSQLVDQGEISDAILRKEKLRAKYKKRKELELHKKKLRAELRKLKAEEKKELKRMLQ